MIIGIDMGHTLSGIGTGAVGYKKESDMNRMVGNRLIEMLREKGHTVVNCTVDYSNNDLYDRVKKANAQHLDLFLSIHLNAAVPEAHGVEIYVYNGSYSGKNELKSIAKKINDEVSQSVGWYNRGVKEADFYVLRETSSNAVLIELGFCTSSSDMNKWNTDVISAALFRGITGQNYQLNTNTNTSTSDLYRVRKSWNDASSQIGAFKNLDSAKSLADKNSGYKVFNSNGTQVYPSNQPSCENGYGEINRYGTFKVTVSSGIKFRDKHCTHCGNVQGVYEYGESVYYDKVCETNKYVWISWIGASTNTRRWMPVIEKSTGDKWGTGI